RLYPGAEKVLPPPRAGSAGDRPCRFGWLWPGGLGNGFRSGAFRSKSPAARIARRQGSKAAHPRNALSTQSPGGGPHADAGSPGAVLLRESARQGGRGGQGGLWNGGGARSGNRGGPRLGELAELQSQHARRELEAAFAQSRGAGRLRAGLDLQVLL